MDHVAVVELVGQHEPGNRDEIRAESKVELIAKVIAERVPVTGRGELVQPMGNNFIGLIDRSLKSELTASNLGGRFHRFSALETGRLLIMISRRKIDAQACDHHTAQGRQQVVLRVNQDVADAVIGEPGEFTGATIGFSQSIQVLMLDPFIGDRDFDAEPIGDAVVQIQRIHLTDCSELPVMAENQLPIVEIDCGNYPVRAVQQSALGCIVIKGVDGEQTLGRHLLLRSDHDKAGDGPARCLRSLGTGPRKEDECKTENESEDEPFPCHDTAGPFSLEESLFPACPTTHSVDHMRNGMRLCCEPMSNGNYREKEGGARLEEVWHASIEGCAELGDVMSARGLSSI